MNFGLVLLLFCCALHLMSNDTLTRAQVYNFNVGDTFDYKIASFSTDQSYYISGDTGFLRKVVKGIYYSTDSSTLFIIEQLHYRDVVSYDLTGNIYISDFTDTLRVDSISKPVLSDLDTTWQNGYTFEYYANNTYHNRMVNGYNLNIPLGGLHYLFYADGLGRVTGGWGYNDGCCSNQQYDTTLVYFSKGAEVWGTPFYNLITGIEQPAADKNGVALYPALNNGCFYVNITGTTAAPGQLLIYDVTGRLLNASNLNNGNNSILMPNAESGVYFWQVTCNGILIQAGKMVVGR